MNEGLRWTGWIVIISAVFIGLLLMLLPLPAWVAPFRPAWLLLALIYWAIALPHRAGIIFAWCWGLLLDILQGALLGENAVAFVMVIYIAMKMHRQIRLFSMPGQMGAVFILILVNQLLLFWIQGLQGQLVSARWFWGVPVTSACLWPWIYLVLTDCLRRYRLH